jgi:hypothetical protein
MLTKQEAYSIAEYIDFYFLQAIRSDPDIDGMAWVSNIMSGYEKLCRYSGYNMPEQDQDRGDRHIAKIIDEMIGPVVQTGDDKTGDENYRNLLDAMTAVSTLLNKIHSCQRYKGCRTDQHKRRSGDTAEEYLRALSSELYFWLH